MATLLFECPGCGAEGKITIKNDEFKKHDISVCPVCAADISQPDDDLDDLD
jgi:transcription elongation factor Elf1